MLAQSRDDHDRLHSDIEQDVREYLPADRQFEWRAAQTSGPGDYCMAFSWPGRKNGQGAFCYNIAEARQAWGTGNAPTKTWGAYIHGLASQALGYEVDSLEDLHAREDEAIKELEKLSQQASDIERRRRVWMGKLRLVLTTRRREYEPEKQDVIEPPEPWGPAS